MTEQYPSRKAEARLHCYSDMLYMLYTQAKKQEPALDCINIYMTPCIITQCRSMTFKISELIPMPININHCRSIPLNARSRIIDVLTVFTNLLLMFYWCIGPASSGIHCMSGSIGIERYFGSLPGFRLALGIDRGSPVCKDNHFSNIL